MTDPNVSFSCCCVEATGTPRHLRLYPWGIKPIDMHADDLKRTPPRPAEYQPVFADKRDIRLSMKLAEVSTTERRYAYSDPVNSVYVTTTIRTDSMVGVGLDDIVKEVVNRLARIYDSIMIRRVFHMDAMRFHDFNSKLRAAGGAMHLLCDDGRPDDMVAIEIPVSMLHHLHIDGDGSIDPMVYFWKRSIPAVRNVETFNDRATVVTFIDGTQTKCVADVDEDGNSNFDLYTGIAFCLFKRMLGKNGHKNFNTLMRKAMRVVEEQEEAEEKLKELMAERKHLNEKKKAQAEKRKLRKMEKQVAMMAEAIRRAGDPNFKIELDPDKVAKAFRDAIERKSKPEELPKTCAECKLQSEDMKCALLKPEEQSCPVTFYPELLDEAGNDVFKTGRRCLCPLEN